VLLPIRSSVGFQCFANKAPALRPPFVGNCRMQLTNDELHNAVFESLFPLVRERHIIRISAEPELTYRLAGEKDKENPWQVHQPLRGFMATQTHTAYRLW